MTAPWQRGPVVWTVENVSSIDPRDSITTGNLYITYTSIRSRTRRTQDPFLSFFV